MIELDERDSGRCIAIDERLCGLIHYWNGLIALRRIIYRLLLLLLLLFLLLLELWILGSDLTFNIGRLNDRKISLRPCGNFIAVKEVQGNEEEITRDQ